MPPYLMVKMFLKTLVPSLVGTKWLATPQPSPPPEHVSGSDVPYQYGFMNASAPEDALGLHPGLGHGLLAALTDRGAMASSWIMRSRPESAGRRCGGLIVGIHPGLRVNR